MKYIYILLTLLITFPVASHSQKKCNKYLEKKCDGYGDPFRFSGQSRNALFELGQKSEFKLAVFGGFEYRVAICAEKNLKGIYFRIREDNTNKNILYDSSSEIEDFLEKMFFVEESKNLIIEVIVPEGDEPKEEQDYSDRYGCMGVLIEYYRKNDSGFN
ncbi:MAG: hypothetical protein JEZ09_05105 [Salinivirgaceae bacterium]|nr:hypothetical protein [Salinivirgaceae bacterium]